MTEDLQLDKGGEEWQYARPVVGLGAAFIGKKIKVLWPPVKFEPQTISDTGPDFRGEWYEADIQNYSEDDGTHTVFYPEDGVVEELCLDAEAWRYA